jgi:hypothetical protein
MTSLTDPIGFQIRQGSKSLESDRMLSLSSQFDKMTVALDRFLASHVEAATRGFHQFRNRVKMAITK